MNKNFLVVLLLIFIASCGPYRETKNGYRIKGKTEILINKEDQSLDGKSVISGYVYSRDMKLFTVNATVVIGDEKVQTDRNGFFSLEVPPGKYNVMADYMGSNKERLNQLIVQGGTRVVIFFQLGTTAMY